MSTKQLGKHAKEGMQRDASAHFETENTCSDSMNNEADATALAPHTFPQGWKMARHCMLGLVEALICTSTVNSAPMLSKQFFSSQGEKQRVVYTTTGSGGSLTDRLLERLHGGPCRKCR